MPYIKKPEQPFTKMKRLLRGYELTGPKMADILGVSPPTGRKRLEQPETLTLGDLDRLSRKGHIPMEELREAIIR